MRLKYDYQTRIIMIWIEEHGANLVIADNYMDIPIEVKKLIPFFKFIFNMKVNEINDHGYRRGKFFQLLPNQ